MFETVMDPRSVLPQSSYTPGMRAESVAILRVVALCVAAALASFPAAPAALAGEWTSSVVETFEADSVPSVGEPFAYLDAFTLQPHLAYLVDGTVRHAWSSGEWWCFEAVAPASRLLDWNAGLAGWPVAILLSPDSVVTCAQRSIGGWIVDPMMPPGTQVIDASLAIDANTQQPVVAMLAAPAGEGVALILAERTKGYWRAEVLDTAVCAGGGVSLAIDAASGVRIVYARRLGPNARPEVLTYLEAPALGAQFTSLGLDTLPATGGFWLPSITCPTLALDPPSQEPRVAYAWGHDYRYAHRMPDQTWHRMITSDGWLDVVQACMALDPSGNPSMVQMAPLGFPVPARPGATAGVRTPTDEYDQTLRVSERAGGTGSGVFDLHVLDTPGSISRRAIVAAAARRPSVFWRGPLAPTWRPAIFHGVYTALADVEPVDGLASELSPPAPNPLRSGQALRCRLALPRAERVALELIDAAGRRVARRPELALTPGAHELEWTPSALAPGCYWLRVRTPAAVLGTRMLIVMR
jgi:hypothetical protein